VEDITSTCHLTITSVGMVEINMAFGSFIYMLAKVSRCSMESRGRERSTSHSGLDLCRNFCIGTLAHHGALKGIS
jgi:hypothetical protein